MTSPSAIEVSELQSLLDRLNSTGVAVAQTERGGWKLYESEAALYELRQMAPDLARAYLAMKAVEHGPHCSDYQTACRQCLDNFAAWKAVERPSTDDWRCVGCKRVIASAAEPERCFHCHCRQFARIDPTTKAVEQPLVLDEVELVGDALNVARSQLTASGFHQKAEQMLDALNSLAALRSKLPVDRERVAKALCAASDDHWFGSGNFQKYNQKYFKLADAAISASRKVRG